MFTLIRYAGFALLTIGPFYGTGWKLAAIDRETVIEEALWSKMLNKSGIPTDAHEGVYKDAVFRDEFIGIQFNDSYYGFEQTNRFFESSLIEKTGLGFAVVALIYGLISLVRDVFDTAEDKLTKRTLDEDDEDDEDES